LEAGPYTETFAEPLTGAVSPRRARLGQLGPVYDFGRPVYGPRRETGSSPTSWSPRALAKDRVHKAHGGPYETFEAHMRRKLPRTGEARSGSCAAQSREASRGPYKGLVRSRLESHVFLRHGPYRSILIRPFYGPPRSRVRLCRPCQRPLERHGDWSLLNRIGAGSDRGGVGDDFGRPLKRPLTGRRRGPVRGPAPAFLQAGAISKPTLSGPSKTHAKAFGPSRRWNRGPQWPVHGFGSSQLPFQEAAFPGSGPTVAFPGTGAVFNVQGPVMGPC